MTNKTEMVSVPRELLERATRDFTGRPSWDALEDIRLKATEELRAILAAPPEDVRAVVDEPVHQVRSHGSCCWEDVSGESLESCRCQPEHYEIRELYRHPQRPVVMPERKQIPDLMMASWHEAKGWNACLDRIAELNK